MSAYALLSVGAVAMLTCMSVLWEIHRRISNAGVVDVGWAGGLVLLAILYAALAPGYGPRRMLMVATVSVWGLRLAIHLLVDRVIGKPEDARYATLRQAWGGAIELKFLFFFLFQGLLDLLLSLPFLLMALNPQRPIALLEWVGAGVWAVAILGEAMADAQLKRFKADPANHGLVCEVGLWNYSRYPNYFFEWLIWIAYFLMAFPSPYGSFAILCPLLMSYFLFKVTGIPATEAQAVRSKGDAYRRYQKTTSVFIPWLKRS